MKYWKQLLQWLDNDKSIRYLWMIVLSLIIVFLFSSTKSIWISLWNGTWSILKPFVYGFAVAFIFAPAITFLQRKGLSKKLSISLVYGLVLIAWMGLIANLIPILSVRFGELISSLIGSVNELYESYGHYLSENTSGLLGTTVRYVIKELSNLQNLVPGVTSELPTFLNGTIRFAVTFIFSLVISIFFSSEWDRIKKRVADLTLRISQFAYEVSFSISSEVQSYVQSLLILMIIKMLEYALVYFVLGHPDWFILSILTGFALLVPYVGPMVVYGLAILTAVGMPWGRFGFFMLVILVLSNVDEYVISPLVHARNTAITPLWVLFSIMVGNTLFGIAGVVIAIPVYLAIHKYLELWQRRKEATYES